MMFPLRFTCNPRLPRCLSAMLSLSINFNFANFIKLLTFSAVLLLYKATDSYLTVWYFIFYFRFWIRSLQISSGVSATVLLVPTCNIVVFKLV